MLTDKPLSAPHQPCDGFAILSGITIKVIDCEIEGGNYRYVNEFSEHI